MGDGEASAHEVRDYVFAEIVTRSRVSVIALELGVKELGSKNVDAHTGQRPGGLAADRRRFFWLFQKIDDAHRVVYRHDAETRGFFERYLDAANRTIGAPVGVALQHVRVIHFVD